MKVVCLLVCITLARYSAGHVFRRQQHPRMESLMVQPLEYINQEEAYYKDSQSQSEERAQNQQREKFVHQKQYHSKKHQQPQKYEQQKYEEQQYDDQYQQPKYQQQQYQPQQQQKLYGQQQQQQKTQQQGLRTHGSNSAESNSQETQTIKEYPMPVYADLSQQQQKQYAQQQQRQYQPQQQQQLYGQQQQQQKTQQQVLRTHDSTSAESNSQETQTVMKYPMPVYADPQNMNMRLIRNKIQMKPTFGDDITWRGVRIAASPSNDVTKEDIEKIFADAQEIMSHTSKEIRDTYHQAYEQAAKTVNEDSLLNATQLLMKNQYAVETHTIKTDDGYLLTLFRIPPRDETLVQRPVVFLMHGLLGSADDWLLMGPKKSLAYLLADAGYEVWLGNARGSKYSRRHVSKNPAQADFWQFGIDEIALHDLPAMIDYMLKTSNQEKLFYVGHSQGTTAYFALAASRPEYNNKIIMMYALAPMAYMSNVRSPLLRMIAPTSPLYERLHSQLGHGEFKPSKELVNFLGGQMCETEIGCKNVCSNVNFVMSGINVENMDIEMIPVIMSHLPAGASARQMKQYAQGVASREFTKYDYGTEINMKVYGSSQPPKYQMEQAKAPVALYYSEEDLLAHPRDVERLAKELPNVKDSYKVPDQHFSHMDFQFSKTAPEVVYQRLIESIQKQQNTQNDF